MKVIVDLLFIVPGHNRGTQTYVNSLLPELAALPDVDLVCITNRLNHRYYAEHLGLQCRVAPVAGSRRPFRILYEQFLMGAAAKKLEGDVLFCPGYLSPVFPTLPTVVVLHDLNFRDIQEGVPPGRRLIYSLLVPSGVRRASAVITVSSFSKERIAGGLSGADGKIAVVQHGPLANPEIAGADWPAVKAKYGVRSDYFLSISNGDPHKNIRRLAQGFVAAQRRSPGGEQLVLVGHRLDAELDAWLRREGFGDAVVATGFVPEAEKLAFLRNGLAYFFPSLYEGFGLPALEAQSCGLPLAASRYGGLPEVCGQGAVYFDAMSVESIADTFLELRDDAELRDILIQAGFANIQRFSWKRAAQETRVILRDAVAGSRLPSPVEG